MGVMDSAIGQAMNLGSGTETRVKDLAQMVVEVAHSKSEIRYGPKRDWDKSNLRLASIEKARKLIDYEPKMPFKQGLENVYKWIVENKDNIERTMKPEYRLW
jgi:nucleoside-diphosphate-sugar epimerase